MWLIYESAAFEKSVRDIPRDILKRYEKWKDVVEFSGVVGLREIKGFHDEKLQGLWQGYRSSRLGGKYRVIYKQVKERFEVHVIRITPHDYRR
jgi:addiction module RelE/StbE family toxin